MLQQKIVSIEGYKDKDGTSSKEYLITQFPATKGLEVEHKLMEGMMGPSLVKDVVCSSVSMGSVKISDKLFDEHFAGQYKHLHKLFDHIIDFNFDTNFTESDSQDQ